MRFQSYLNTAIKIISLYDGSVPLHHFLKQYFSQQKKHGSTDRKIITHACYNFYRLGKCLTDINIEEKLKTAIFICNDKTAGWSFLYDEEWLANWSDSLLTRIEFVEKKYNAFSLKNVFPFFNELSESLDASAFIRSFFVQPNVFIRMRPGYAATVNHNLQHHNISFNIIDENCIALSPSVKIDEVINIDEEAVVQDYSSQRIKEFIQLAETEAKNLTSHIVHHTSVWDCCAGSGGKSILACDVLSKIDLTVSDVRASIIQNLKQRFAKAGIKNYKSFVFDVANSKLLIPNSLFDLIICDAPCTGSGTWSRTPEQLYFFNASKINQYVLLQTKIVTNAIKYVKDNCYFLYVTCSVFKKENEIIVDFIKQQFNFEIVKMELLEGYDKKADTMFAALLRKKM